MCVCVLKKMFLTERPFLSISSVCFFFFFLGQVERAQAVSHSLVVGFIHKSVLLFFFVCEQRQHSVFKFASFSLHFGSWLLR